MDEPKFKVGDHVYFYNCYGEYIPGTVQGILNDKVCVDGNFPKGDHCVWKNASQVFHQEDHKCYAR